MREHGRNISESEESATGEYEKIPFYEKKNQVKENERAEEENRKQWGNWENGSGFTDLLPKK